MPRDGLCRKCGRDAAGLDGEFLCEDCRVHRPYFDRAASVFYFMGEARDLVNAFKFRERLEIRGDLVDFLEAKVRTHFRIEEIDCVVPIPSTLGHRFLRGYNQCVLLAKPLAKRLGKPYINLLKRTGHPLKQGRLSETDRRTNVVGTFAVRGTGRVGMSGIVLLVDDIMTTGSTLSEAAKTLKAAGVEKVWTISLARSIRG